MGVVIFQKIQQNQRDFAAQQYELQVQQSELIGLEDVQGPSRRPKWTAPRIMTGSVSAIRPTGHAVRFGTRGHGERFSMWDKTEAYIID